MDFANSIIVLVFRTPVIQDLQLCSSSVTRVSSVDLDEVWSSQKGLLILQNTTQLETFPIGFEVSNNFLSFSCSNITRESEAIMVGAHVFFEGGIYSTSQLEKKKMASTMVLMGLRNVCSFDKGFHAPVGRKGRDGTGLNFGRRCQMAKQHRT